MVAPKTVAQLKANILRPALTSHYSVKFAVPDAASQFITNNSGVSLDVDFFEVSCSEASLPGSSFATLDIVNDYVGVNEKHAYRRLYDDRADFTFYVNHNYVPIRFFESWMRYIAGESYAGGVEKRTFTSRPTWPDNYSTDKIEIIKYERDYGSQLKYTFIKAFPVSINSIPVSYDTSNLLKVTVSFVYSRYYVGRFSDVPEQSTIEQPAPVTTQPITSNTPFITQNILTNEYYNNFGRSSQDATNSANFFNGRNVDQGVLGSSAFA
jgi:hypothetical protein